MTAPGDQPMSHAIQSARLLALALTAVLALAWGGQARAQSFECEKARSRVEHLICATPALRTADEQMFDAFNAAMDIAADQPKVRRDQRAWLKQRDACASAACVSAAYQARAAVLKQTPRAGWKTYSNPALGITFQYFGNRTIAPCADETYPNCVTMMGWWYGQTIPFMDIRAVPGPLDKVAEDEAGFVMQEGKLVTSFGMGMPQPVERFTAPGLTGLRATIACGVTDENGPHAAAGDCQWTVVSDGRRSILIVTEGRAGLDAESQRSLSTLRFLRP